ncbi:AMP-binding protein (plasmid) [Tistrella mobilis]|uniref:AMP-dependent synthetase n=1 Tax=Tistrella mobilis TaxID=171437 RepID=A0A162LRC0_9PROT|nr:AMP-binding protein [Tistrella mobilis]KYO56443.1 AMP-dependent synthetase [Tistrella mobilis]
MNAQALFAMMVQQGDVVTDRFRDAVRHHPDQTFIRYGEEGRDLSFAAFEAEVATLAAALQEMGLEPDDRVSVFTRNSWIATLAMFAVWEAGAVYAPVNFNYAGRLLAYQLNDTAPRVLITDADLALAVAAVLDEVRLTNIVVHRPLPSDHDHDPAKAALPPALLARPGLHDLAELMRTPRRHRPVTRGAADIANIIYTSGTTGPAKGVVQPFRWINQYTFKSRAFLTPEDTIYCDLPLYHVGGAMFLVAKACWTGCAVSLWDKFSPTRFWDRVRAHRASNAVLLDVMVPWLMSADPRADDRDNTMMRVHMQPLPARHHEVAQRFGIPFSTAGFGQTESGNGFVALIDQFGETEAKRPEFRVGHDRATVLEIARRRGVMVVDGAEPLAKGFMGRPSPLLEAAVLDADDNVLGPDEAGQLAFRPRFPHLLLKSYFNKPDATIKTFSNLWFHTGDAVRRTEDDVYYFIDRMGGFFRVRGENVSSYQVEDLLNTHPDIRATAALPVPAEEGEEEDCAVFIQLVEGCSMTEAELRSFAASVMPRYMTPRHVRFVEALPVTPTNKIEKYKLKQSLLAELAAARAAAETGR